MQTIGERLEEARKKKGISIREAAEATKIRGDYLQKFESNHFDIGLTEIYARGFLRTYSNFLKLPADRILNDFAALGRGEVRPRQPSREIYGRMDISVATAENAERTPTPEEPVAAAPEPSHANRGPQRSRAISSLPTGPDPAVVFKYMKWGGGAIIALLALLIIKSLFFGSSHRATTTPATTTQAPKGPTVGLNALGTVRVMVYKVGADGFSNGEQLFSAILSAGDTRSVPRPGAIFIEADKPELLEIVINGTPYNLAKMIGPGNTKGQLGAPPGSSG